MKKAILIMAGLLLHMQAFCQKEILVQMVFVKGGSFFMGSDDPHYHSPEFENERPVHRVSVTDFYIAKYEVTLGQYRKLMGMYPPAYNGVDYGNKYCDECPVVMLSWEDAKAFIKKLNERDHKNYRLPTETEWEYAARGGKYAQDKKYAGSNKLSTVAWYGRKNGATSPVGKKEPNELSIYDMAGNVAEWCEDWYGEDYYKGVIDAMNPKGPAGGKLRVVRGGSYFDEADECRSVHRSRYDPKKRQWNLGFRLAMDAPSGSTAQPGKAEQ
ncbi:MAG: SUMF1/EgtB/PvdO family nonheme iron enzyme [Bacteroidota bacterium]